MNEENKIVEDLNRLELKKIRKERKLLKKTLKREERERENDKKQLLLKLGPKDQHITIISRNVANNINKFKEISSCSNNSDVNINNIDDNFPELGSTNKPKRKQLNTNIFLNKTIATNHQTVSTQETVNTLTINLTECLVKPKPVVTKNSATERNVQKYSGNILDSSQPKRQKGKRREIVKPKPLTKIKVQIINDMKKCDNSYSNFCNNVVTDELNIIVNSFLCNIVRFQENLYKRDPIKGIAKRRYITGFREVKKFLFVKRLKFFILAPDNKNVVENGILDTVIHELISIATENNIPYVFALSRRKLGQITLKNVPINCVGIFYYDGAEQSFAEILKLLETLRKPNEVSDPL